LLKCGNAATDFGKEVASFKFEKVFVNECHGSAEIEKESMPDKGEMGQRKQI
jgi:hypothetical protein